MSTDTIRTASPITSGQIAGHLGAYQIVELIARSQNVEQYSAKQRGPCGFERTCLLKVARKRRGDHRDVDMLAREAKVLVRLDHHSILRVFDFFDFENRAVLVLEQFSNLTLSQLLELLKDRGESLDERAAWHVTQSLFEALAHCHGLSDDDGNPAPVIHGDIRPSNILIGASGRIRLSGFSSAQIAWEDDDDDDATACREVASVPSYLAPELFKGGKAGESADAFSAALIAWELLTQRSASPSARVGFDLITMLAERRPQSLRALRSDIPALVSTALDQCLMNDPLERRIRCEEVAGCIASGLAIGQSQSSGAHVLRDTIERLGPAILNLAGGRARSDSPIRRSIDAPRAAFGRRFTSVPDAPSVSSHTETVNGDARSLFRGLENGDNGADLASVLPTVPPPAPEPVPQSHPMIAPPHGIMPLSTHPPNPAPQPDSASDVASPMHQRLTPRVPPLLLMTPSKPVSESLSGSSPNTPTTKRSSSLDSGAVSDLRFIETTDRETAKQDFVEDYDERMPLSPPRNGTFSDNASNRVGLLSRSYTGPAVLQNKVMTPRTANDTPPRARSLSHTPNAIPGPPRTSGLAKPNESASIVQSARVFHWIVGVSLVLVFLVFALFVVFVVSRQSP